MVIFSILVAVAASTSRGSCCGCPEGGAGFSNRTAAIAQSKVIETIFKKPTAGEDGICGEVGWCRLVGVDVDFWMFLKIVGFTSKSSILIGFVMENPFWGTTIFGNTHFGFILVAFELFEVGIYGSLIWLVGSYWFWFPWILGWFELDIGVG